MCTVLLGCREGSFVRRRQRSVGTRSYRCPRSTRRRRPTWCPRSATGRDDRASGRRSVDEPALVGGARVGGVVVDVELQRGVSFGEPRVGRYVEYVNWLEPGERLARVVARRDPTPGRCRRRSAERCREPAGGLPDPLTHSPLPSAPSLRKNHPPGAEGVTTRLTR